MSERLPKYTSKQIAEREKSHMVSGTGLLKGEAKSGVEEQVGVGDYFYQLQIGDEVEVPISDEEKGQVLAKIRDINKDTAFTITDVNEIDVDVLRSILKSGILGTEMKSSHISGLENSPEIWRERIRQKKMPFVHFDISGSRMGKNDDREFMGNKSRIIDNWYSGAGEGVSRDEIGFTFDLSQYKEGDPVKKEKDLTSSVYGKTNIYYPELRERNGKKEIRSYLMASRVSPRNLTGIFFANTTKELRTEDDKQLDIARLQQFGRTKDEIAESLKRYAFKSNPEENTDPKALTKIAKGIAKIMMESGVRIPIYDIHGNLWWPEQISCRQISKKNKKTIRHKS